MATNGGSQMNHLGGGGRRALPLAKSLNLAIRPKPVSWHPPLSCPPGRSPPPFYNANDLLVSDADFKLWFELDVFFFFYDDSLFDLIA